MAQKKGCPTAEAFAGDVDAGIQQLNQVFPKP
jgi:hypothetical protein